jgi:hypothetical protein
MIHVDIYCILNISMKLLLLLLIPVLSFAKGDECINEHTPDLRKFCMARQYANSTACDSISNLDLKTSCIATVRAKHRESMWAIRPIDVATADVRGDKKYIWQR